MKVKSNHPLAEILAKKLFSIETVPAKDQAKMVRRAIKAAVEFYEKKNKKMQTGAECEECKEGRQWNGVNFCMKCGTDLRR